MSNAAERLEFLVNMLSTLVRGGKSPKDAAKQMTQLLNPGEIQQVLQEYAKQTGRIRILKEPTSFQAEGLEAWYTGPGPDDQYWPALRNYLQGKGWEENALSSLDDASTKIVSFLSPPGVGSFSTKGLVLGYVQSGKTANFTAVLAKSADVNYKFFIVLSGIHNNLRSQTQKRLDRELVSLNSDDWYSLTNSEQDFKQSGNVNAFLTDRHGQKVLCVVKKNAAVLRRLRNWLQGARNEILRDCPVLIIDDEADQASVNTARNQAYRTTINNLIIEILNLLPKSAYVGYTATPFANVLIDPTIPEDLYPRDFIIDLPKPENYFGPERIFGRKSLEQDETDEKVEGLALIKTVKDDEVISLQPRSRDERFDFEPELTSSLKDALQYFWMATAARRVRGDADKHSTMLIHTTVYTEVHERFRTLITYYSEEFGQSLENNDDGLLNELRIKWNEELNAVPPADASEFPVSFDEVLEHLAEVHAITEIAVENSRSDLRLEYGEQAKVVIVVGGNTLSRGLTLEGLIVSFFIRTASAYDTLLQMGRWFGYRSSYSDLPRIWMTEELKGFFLDLATVEQEIRNDIRRYERENITPLDFAVRIRTHPKMAITSRLKMQKAVPCSVTYSDKRLQTFKFRHRDANWLQGNLKASQDLIAKMQQDDITPVRTAQGSRWIFQQVPVSCIIDFLNAYQFHEDHDDLKPNLLLKYIQEQNKKGNLNFWNVGIISQQHESSLGSIDLGLSEQVPLINRSKLRMRGAGDEHANIKALMSRVDRVADLFNLSAEKLRGDDDALQDIRNDQLNGVSKVGLLLLYPISKDSRPERPPASGKVASRAPLDAVEHIIGVGLVFPDAQQGQDTPVSYMSADLSGVPQEEEDWLDEDEI